MKVSPIWLLFCASTCGFIWPPGIAAQSTFGNPAPPATPAGPDPTFVDSLLIIMAKPKDEVLDLVVEAFTLAGLAVTNITGPLVTADAGTTDDGLLGVAYSRTARAIVMRHDSATTVLITGVEIRKSSDGSTAGMQQLRIDNKAGGNGEKVWCRMVLAALKLDSTQVSADARKQPGKCEQRWKQK